MKTQTNYRGYTIQHLFSGWYSTKSVKFGYLKADTLKGLKKLIDAELLK